MRRLPFVVVYLMIFIILFFSSKHNITGNQINNSPKLKSNVLTVNTLRGVDVGNETTFDSLKNNKKIESDKHVSGNISESENLFGDFSGY